ncbi:MAG: beta-ketoacyl-[acyl-carrier-protein] synthase family protein, partial [Betaproteobacteria bacterium]|nr:beta-ketoacyl-[acyl-carrier-protein] synthase family protein [Betaproteobacteria bacterium]
MADRRVAVTGAGIVSPIGNTLEDFQRSLCDARPGIRRLPGEIAQRTGVQVAATVEWNPMSVLKENEAAGVDRATQFALGAASQALAASGLDTRAAPERIGVYWGTGLGGASTQEAAYRQVYRADQWRLRPLTVVMA